MDVMLVRPHYHTHLITPPLSLGYLASYLRGRGWGAKVIDGVYLELDNREMVEQCRDAPVVGINCLSDYFPAVVDLSRRLKRAGKTVVVGGPHASALPEATLRETEADYVVVGEGEETLAELVERLARGQGGDGVPGVYSGQARFTPRPMIEALDEVPFPDWDQLDPRKYPWAPYGGIVKSFPVAPVITSRGCVFACKFCASARIWGRRIRYRSAENVVDEVELLVRKHGVREVQFVDDNITQRTAHIAAICEAILGRGLKVDWALPSGARADLVTPDLLKLMRRAGCYSLAFGVESGSEELLRNVDKKLDLATIERAVRAAHEAGLVTQGFFILGLPGETIRTIEQTIRFALKLPLDKAQFLLLDVLPGSALWHELPEEARRDWRWTYRSYQEPSWLPDGLDRATLSRMQAIAFRRFFLRPRQILVVLRYLRLRQLPYVFRRLGDFGVLSRY